MYPAFIPNLFQTSCFRLNRLQNRLQTAQSLNRLQTAQSFTEETENSVTENSVSLDILAWIRSGNRYVKGTNISQQLRYLGYTRCP